MERHLSLESASLDKLYEFKEAALNRLGVDRLLSRLLALGITPNKLTALSLALGAASVVLLFRHPLGFAVCILHRFALDGLDGYFARRFHLQSVLGDRLDHWGDLSINAALLGSSLLYSDFPGLSVLALFAYLGEYGLLKMQNLLARRFPTGIFIFFFIAGLYGPGLAFQILYQIGSHIHFRLFMKPAAEVH
jgi:hypothetical protein